MNFTKNNFIMWLRSHVKKSIQDDVGSVLNLYYKSGSGFFAVPRLLFPEIDGLGAFITGEKKATGKNIVAWLSTIMSKIDPRYSEYAAFITHIFRHGLMHQHAPKKFKYGKVIFGWTFAIDSGHSQTQIARKDHLIWRNNTLRLDMRLFYEDVVNSIELFITMIDNKEVNFKKIKSAYHAQYKPVLRNELITGGSSYTSKNDFVFLRKLMLNK